MGTEVFQRHGKERARAMPRNLIEMREQTTLALPITEPDLVQLGEVMQRIDPADGAGAGAHHQ